MFVSSRAVTPPATLIVPPTSAMLLPVMVTLPSSKFRLLALPAAPMVTVYVPVASVPAAKYASFPLPKVAVVAAVPRDDVDQNGLPLVLPQVPVGAVPAPSVAPLPSQ